MKSFEEIKAAIQALSTDKQAELLHWINQWGPPEALLKLESFLEEKGFTCKRHETVNGFDNMVIQYEDDCLAIKFERDRGKWSIEITQLISGSKRWFYLEDIREFILGSVQDHTSLIDKIEFVMKNWDEIVRRFSTTQLAETHARLPAIAKERFDRRFPGLRTS